MLGFFYLCVLPSTVSSSIAMTAMARGNIAGAVFNATLSSLIGMVLTPLYVGLYMTEEHHGVPLVEQFIKIGEQLLLPLTIGQFLRHWIGDWIMRNKSRVGLVARTVLVLLAPTSFCRRTVTCVWPRLGTP